MNGFTSFPSTCRKYEIRVIIRFFTLHNETAPSIRWKLVEPYGNEVMTLQRSDAEGQKFTMTKKLRDRPLCLKKL